MIRLLFSYLFVFDCTNTICILYHTAHCLWAAFYHMGHSSAYSPIFARSVKSLIYHIFTHKVLTLRSYLLGARNLQFYSDAGKFRTGTSILMYTLYSTLSELLKYHRYKAPLDLSLISGVLIYGIYEVIIWRQHLE